MKKLLRVYRKSLETCPEEYFERGEGGNVRFDPVPLEDGDQVVGSIHLGRGDPRVIYRVVGEACQD